MENEDKKTKKKSPIETLAAQPNTALLNLRRDPPKVAAAKRNIRFHNRLIKMAEEQQKTLGKAKLPDAQSDSASSPQESQQPSTPKAGM